jgi:hypothetical protein
MMRRSLLFSLSIVLLGCITSTSLNHSDVSSSVIVENQGIQGVVRRLTGNHMPRIGDRTPGDTTEPVQTTVWIFTGQILSYGSAHWAVSEARQHSRLMKQVESDATGQFSAELPLGEYTVMAQYGDDLYLNAFLGNGSYATVQVESGQIVEVLLDNTESAAF